MDFLQQAQANAYIAALFPREPVGWRAADSTQVWLLTVSSFRIAVFVLPAYTKTTFFHLKWHFTFFKERKYSIFELDHGKLVGIS